MQLATSELTPFHIRNLIYELLRHGEMFGADVVDHFLNLLDWTDAAQTDRETVAMLNLLRDASRRYELGDLPLSGYQDVCVSLFFPASVRSTPRHQSPTNAPGPVPSRHGDSGGSKKAK